MGDRLQIETDGGRIVLEVTFPMLTLSKCKIKGKGKLSQLSKGMRVYRYSKDEPVQDTAVKPGKTETFGNMEFCYIPGGTYMMGSPKSEKDRQSVEKQHRVTLSPFWMGKYEVTQKQYEEIMGTNPSHFKGNNLPVEVVSWYNAVEFCNKLSIKHGLKPYYNIDKSRKDPNNKNSYDDIKWTVTIAGGNGFRLPTEAEWEYACRAGTTTAFSFGDRWDAAASRQPNPWGLYDMHGNVWEWCQDWFSADYHQVWPNLTNNPKGPPAGDRRVQRGGSYLCHDSYCNRYRVSARIGNTPDTSGGNVGFRCARSISS